MLFQKQLKHSNVNQSLFHKDGRESYVDDTDDLVTSGTFRQNLVSGWNELDLSLSHECTA